MNPYMARFIENVLSEVKCAKVHPYILDELEDHIETLKESYIEEGFDEDKAYQKAVSQMGDASLIGKDFHKIHKPKLEWSVLVLLIGLMSIGLIALYYWGGYQIDVGGSYYFFKKQIVFIVMGSLVFIGAYYFNYKYIEKWTIPLYLLGIGILIYGTFFGSYVNGVGKWITVGPIAFQVTHLAIPILIISYVGLVRRLGNNKIQNNAGLGVLGLLPSLMLIKIEYEYSYGILLGVSLVMVLTFHITSPTFRGDKVKLLGILYSSVLGIGSFLGLLLIKRKTYMFERIYYFLNPQLDPNGAGYMPRIMKEIREYATLIGDGGFSAIDIRYLPEPTYDMILTFIVGSMGWLAAGIVISMIAFIIIRLFVAALKVNEGYGRLLNLSIASLFAIQFIYNIAMNLGYVPQLAVTLPFISYGGTAIIINLALMGLFLGVYRRKDIVHIVTD